MMKMKDKEFLKMCSKEFHAKVYHEIFLGSYLPNLNPRRICISHFVLSQSISGVGYICVEWKKGRRKEQKVGHQKGPHCSETRVI